MLRLGKSAHQYPSENNSCRNIVWDMDHELSWIWSDDSSEQLYRMGSRRFTKQVRYPGPDLIQSPSNTSKKQSRNVPVFNAQPSIMDLIPDTSKRDAIHPMPLARRNSIPDPFLAVQQNTANSLGADSINSAESSIHKNDSPEVEGKVPDLKIRPLSDSNKQSKFEVSHGKSDRAETPMSGTKPKKTKLIADWFKNL